jgi:hypothetical protein
LMIIQPYIAAQGVLQALGRIEAGGGQHLADTAIEALDHAVGLGMTGLDSYVPRSVVPHAYYFMGDQGVGFDMPPYSPGWLAI